MNAPHSSSALAVDDPRFSIAGSNYPLTDEQRELVGLAEQLGRERFAPRAAQYDREATFPFENYDDMRTSGLLGLCIPKQAGGLGADLRTYSLVSATIGKYCGATALTFNMHACTTLWTGLLSEDLDMTAAEREEHRANQQLHFKRVLNGAVYAQPFSEGSAAAAGKAPFGTVASRVDGGWLINGKKIFASLADGADYFGLLCTEDRGDSRSMRDTLYIAVPRNAPGLSIVGDWDPLGMRGTVSRNLVFKDVFVAANEQLMPRGVYFQAASRWPHMFTTLSPTYMGITVAAYEFTVKYLRGEIEGMGPPVKRRMFPTKQITTAEMHIKLEQARALFLRMLDDARVDPPKDARMRALASQFTVMETAQDMCRLAIRTCGGQSMLKSLPLERMYRDARCGSLMLPWTAELCLDRLGREALYESGEQDD
ncbi:MAG: acyl-CoA/acyl-ACP dehydrogenase [Burkholderiales bacterium]|nr:MAG: acyl-CoA/acyl-ACP dehydrogenase [Burkholderiales bacterium]